MIHTGSYPPRVGCSRPLDKVGLAPRQYMEWNEVGRAHSTGDLSQQELLPKVCCTACTKGVLTKTTKYQRDLRLCALEAYIAGDTLCHQPMVEGHVTVPQLHGPMSCNGVTQCWPTQRGQAIVPGSSPYMVHEKWIQARALS